MSKWLAFQADRTVKLAIGKVEIGQGVLTALTQIAAEELDVAMDRFTIVSGDTRDGEIGSHTPLVGRAFKIGGYTQAGGEGLAARIPLSAMVQGSFTNTRTALPDGAQPHHYDTNNNFSLDQISVFVAGRVSENTGGFFQFTWSDVTNQVNVDNADLRPYTKLFTIGEDTDLRLGTTINNNPYPDTAARVFNAMWRSAYNLRGLSTPQCPECGYSFTWPTFFHNRRIISGLHDIWPLPEKNELDVGLGSMNH